MRPLEYWRSQMRHGADLSLALVPCTVHNDQPEIGAFPDESFATELSRDT